MHKFHDLDLFSYVKFLHVEIRSLPKFGVFTSNLYPTLHADDMHVIQ